MSGLGFKYPPKSMLPQQSAHALHPLDTPTNCLQSILCAMPSAYSASQSQRALTSTSTSPTKPRPLAPRAPHHTTPHGDG
eukprot:2441713-Pyramimonas_sp.AAC.1